eukprot:g5281.t1
MEDRLDEFEQAWRDGDEPPAISDFLPGEDDPDRSELLRELVKIDIDLRWRAVGGNGNGATQTLPADVLPRLEDYLKSFPELGSTDDCPLELILHEFRVRDFIGDTPSYDEYRERFSGRADEVVSCLSSYEATKVAANDTTDIQRQRPAAATIAEGQQFGEYELLTEIARGGMGVVYKARQTKANRIVALKMILSGNLAGQEEIDRFHTEAEAAARLDHPNIVPLYDVGEADGNHYFSMAFVEGQSLAELVREQPLDPRRSAELVVQIAQALAYAHEKNIVHRDLKPANILIDAAGTPRVTDFGLAKQIENDSGLTATGQVLGTPSYMPPEQALGRTEETLQQVAEQEPVPPRRVNPAVDHDLDTIVLKALQKNAEHRYASAREFADDIDRFLQHRPILARRTSAAARSWRWAKRNRLAAALLVLISVSLVAGLGLTSYASVVYRRMADEESRLRKEETRLREEEARLRVDLSESLYVASMNAADDVIEKSALQQTTANVLARWFPGNPKYRKFVPKESGDLRGWEWYFLFGLPERHRIVVPGRLLSADISHNRLGFGFQGNFAILQFGQTFGGVTWNAHGQLTTAVKFSPDGRQFASAGADGSIAVWEVESRRKIAEFQNGAAVGSLAFNKRGTLLAGHGVDAKIRIWNLETQSQARVITENVSPVPACSISDDGKQLAASVRLGNTFAVRIWDLSSGTPRATFQKQAHTEPIQSIDWSPDGGGIVTASRDRTVRVWNVKDGSLRFSMQRHDQPVFAVAWSPDGETIASGGDDMEIYLTDARTGEQTNVFGHTGGESATVRSLAWLPNGKKLMAAYELGNVQLFDFEKPRPIQRFQVAPTRRDQDVAVIRSNPKQPQFSITYGGVAKQWSHSNGMSAVQPETLTCWNSNGELAASMRGRELIVRKAGGAIARIPLSDSPRSLLWNPKHDTLAIHMRRGVQLWRSTAPKELESTIRLELRPREEVDSIAWSSDGERVLVGTSLGALGIHRHSNGKRIVRIQLSQKSYQPNRIRAIAWRPGSTIFAIGTSINYIFLYDFKTIPRKEGDKLIDIGIGGHDAHIRALAWSPDGTRLATGGADRTVRLWDFNADTLDGISNKRVLTLPHDSEVRDIQWGANGRRLITLTDKGRVTIFDATDGYNGAAAMQARPGDVDWQLKPK